MVDNISYITTSYTKEAVVVDGSLAEFWPRRTTIVVCTSNPVGMISPASRESPASIRAEMILRSFIVAAGFYYFLSAILTVKGYSVAQKHTCAILRAKVSLPSFITRSNMCSRLTAIIAEEVNSPSFINVFLVTLARTKMGFCMSIFTAWASGHLSAIITNKRNTTIGIFARSRAEVVVRCFVLARGSRYCFSAVVADKSNFALSFTHKKILLVQDIWRSFWGRLATRGEPFGAVSYAAPIPNNSIADLEGGVQYAG